MQIISVNISNLLSFPYQETLDPSKGTRFDIHQDGGVNVLIGPNGAGKTNFLRIITQVLKSGLMQDFIYIPTATDPKQIITLNPVFLHEMRSHIAHPEKPSLVDMQLHITPNDKDNMLFLQKQRNLFNTIIQTNTTLAYTIPEITTQDIQNLQTLHIQFSIDTTNQTATIIRQTRTIQEQFAIDYLTYQELFQICIIHYNAAIKKSEEKAFYPLKNTFGSTNAHRTFNSIKDNQHNTNLWETYIANKNTPGYSSIIGYALCIKKIRNILNHSSEENAYLPKEETILTPESIKTKLQNSVFFKSLQENIKKYIDLDLNIIYQEGEILFSFVDNNGQEHNIHSLSNGEQSLLIMILTIYGHDLKNGLLIIDEPEMHFHPQMQKRLIRMLEKLNENIGTQCIVSTYSPIFINEKNITNVYRFSKIDGNTVIKAPEGGMGEDESTIIQILKFENASKIFFVDKIIMVEGEIDAYFFEFYLQYLHTFPERKNKLVNYEIVNINGKGGYKKRDKFLKKFGIQCSFIGDWDNIVDYGFMTQSDLNYYYKQAKSHYANSKRNKQHTDRHYTKLVNTVKELYPAKYSYILQNIQNLYKQKVYILQRGDIETYLGMASKGLEETIEFCHHYFHLWLKNNDLIEHRNEMNDIINKIFS